MIFDPVQGRNEVSNLQSQYLEREGFAFLKANSLPISNDILQYSYELAREWDHMRVDQYLKEGAAFRERRYGSFAFHSNQNQLHLLPHKPYFQSKTANSYAGGIERELAPLTDEFVANPLLRELIFYDYESFPTTADQDDDWWLIACHLFRIIGKPTERGEPTPEGVHRDEIDFGAMHLMRRQNVLGGYSRIHFEDKTIKSEVVMREHLDTLYWDDRKILHSVTPITPENISEQAIRDILILGFTKKSDIANEIEETIHENP